MYLYIIHELIQLVYCPPSDHRAAVHVSRQNERIILDEIHHCLQRSFAMARQGQGIEVKPTKMGETIRHALMHITILTHSNTRFDLSQLVHH